MLDSDGATHGTRQFKEQDLSMSMEISDLLHLKYLWAHRCGVWCKTSLLALLLIGFIFYFYIKYYQYMEFALATHIHLAYKQRKPEKSSLNPAPYGGEGRLFPKTETTTLSRNDKELGRRSGTDQPNLHDFQKAISPIVERFPASDHAQKMDLINELKRLLKMHFPVHSLVCSTTFNKLDTESLQVLFHGAKEILSRLSDVAPEKKPYIHVLVSSRGIEFHLQSPELDLNSSDLFSSHHRLVELLNQGTWTYIQEFKDEHGVFVALLTANSRPI